MSRAKQLVEKAQAMLETSNSDSISYMENSDDLVLEKD